MIEETMICVPVTSAAAYVIFDFFIGVLAGMILQRIFDMVKT